MIGRHLLLDVYDAINLDDAVAIKAMLHNCVYATGATLLYTYIHPFPGGGLTGVAILAESHISIHTWPEKNFAAIDIFMCGKASPYKAIPVIEKALGSANMTALTRLRGE